VHPAGKESQKNIFKKTAEKRVTEMFSLLFAC
jgi:hypothetical protein